MKENLKKAFLFFTGHFESPRDRILSAVSRDGIHWKREPGVRIDTGGAPGCEMVYYPYAVSMPGGGYRMFYYGSFFHNGRWSGGVLSATSTDGLKWHKEKGMRLSPGGIYDNLHCQSPCVIASSQSGYRMYYTGLDNEREGRILLARSDDMLCWRKEEKSIIDYRNIEGCSSVSDPAVIALGDGKMRMYFTGSFDETQKILSAISSDGEVWRVEDGIRIGPQAPGCGMIANNPSIIEEKDGCHMYFRGGDMLVLYNNIFHAFSEDGINWNVTGVALSYDRSSKYERHAVGFPMLMKTREGVWRMYYTGYWGRFWGEKKLISHWLAVNREAGRKE